ncbi:aaa-family atpase [Anaeramoeba flamelloides]|uniref:Aaa-family atpase n=1 Tax=Anaeramoeba flamelloides TaxID=1746091 RepID=A0AAV7YXC3_9EUKA|nr:aaa-family atpase [Anaeramoeba flamelloides]
MDNLKIKNTLFQVQYSKTISPGNLNISLEEKDQYNFQHDSYLQLVGLNEETPFYLGKIDKIYRQEKKRTIYIHGCEECAREQKKKIPEICHFVNLPRSTIPILSSILLYSDKIPPILTPTILSKFLNHRVVLNNSDLCLSLESFININFSIKITIATNLYSIKPQPKEFQYGVIKPKTKIILVRSKNGNNAINLRKHSFDIQHFTDKQKQAFFTLNNLTVRPSTLLLTGPNGTGKRFILKAFSCLKNYNLITINNLIYQVRNQEANLKQIYKQACSAQPCILHFENLHAMCPKSTRNGITTEKFIQDFLYLCKKHSLKKQKYSHYSDLVIVATSSLPKQINEKVLNIFEETIEFQLPSSKERINILKSICKCNNLKVQNLDVLEIDQFMFGFSISLIQKIISFVKIKKYQKKHKIQEQDERKKQQQQQQQQIKEERERERGKEEKKNICNYSADVSTNDLIEILKQNWVKNLITKDIKVEIPNVKWNQIYGLDSVKERLKEAAIWIYQYKQIYTNLGIQKSSAILLYGPPGNNF